MPRPLGGAHPVFLGSPILALGWILYLGQKSKCLAAILSGVIVYCARRTMYPRSSSAMSEYNFLRSSIFPSGIRISFTS
jgi:hypothetical protein